MPSLLGKLGRGAAIIALLAGIAACGSSSDTSSGVTSTVPDTSATVPVTKPLRDPPAETKVPQDQAATAIPDVAPRREEPQAVMPNVVCHNLQDAQNTIQRAGVFYSRSADGTGQGRMQLIDSNWVVTSQVPAPGTPFGEGDAILTAVKYGEPGAC